MLSKGLVVIADRGGHLHDALRLIEQMQLIPEALITTVGPDVAHLQKSGEFPGARILSIPLFFTWTGKIRWFNPFKLIYQSFLSLFYAFQIRPKFVISSGASDVIPFCYFAWALGAKIIHVDNLAQVKNASVTGRMLYPIAAHFFVQWEDLKSQYGPKARYAGWVI